MKVNMFPGQGSQYKGMGKDLFGIFSREVRQASEILGYDMEELCLKDPRRELGKTQFTQPALYVVNALAYLNRPDKAKPSYLIGHSLGEYNALLAAGAFDFETGLRLVQKRGALMAAASGGGMAAVLGLKEGELKQRLESGGYLGIDIANYNTPTQFVLAGQLNEINKVVKDFDAQKIKVIPLFVSAPFHSRYMKAAASEFGGYLKGFKFSPLQIPVISNVTCRPYEDNQVAALLSRQIESSVQWTNTIRFLNSKGVTDYEEINGVILTKMVNEITMACSDEKELEEVKTKVPAEKVLSSVSSSEKIQNNKPVSGRDTKLSTRLGSKEFREDYGVKYTYVAGAMYRGIASKELIVCMARVGMLGFFGTGGLSLQEVEYNIKSIQAELKNGESYGFNLLHHLSNPSFEMRTVELFLRYKVQKVEAAAFMQITPSLVYYHLNGLRKDREGDVICDNKIMAKVSRPEVAEMFMRPAPQNLVNKLLEDGKITAEQAMLSRLVPMSYDICVEADSGGHTDGGVAMALLPSIQQLKTIIEREYKYPKSVRVGLAGGIGTPQAAACAYLMRADFILTGSINQCTVEAGTSDAVKDLLQGINVQDTDYAPAGDMFEIGAKVQVLKKGVLFPARANKLYSLYNQYSSIDDLPGKTIEQLENSYFKKPISTIWEETRAYFINKGQLAEFAKAEQNPKQKMALIFRWYFRYSNKLAFAGDINDKVNFQVHTGPALGAFNQWVKGTELESWRKRHVDKIGIMIMNEAAQLLEQTLQMINN